MYSIFFACSTKQNATSRTHKAAVTHSPYTLYCIRQT